MIDLKSNTIRYRNKIHNIDHWEVWFQTPWGLFDDRLGAVERCLANDVDPDSNVVPVAIALAEGDIYEVCQR
jgi:hypothetical protein